MLVTRQSLAAISGVQHCLSALRLLRRGLRITAFSTGSFLTVELDKVLPIEPKDLSNGDKSMSVSDAIQARELFREAFPVSRYGKVAAALLEGYRFMKPLVETRIDRAFTMRRVRSLHEGKAKRVDGAELDALKLAKFEEERREYKELKKRLEQMEGALAMADATLSRQAVDADSRSPASMGRSNRTRTEG